MKPFLNSVALAASLAALCSPGLLLAQTAAPVAPAKAAVKPPAKPNQQLARSAAKAVEEVTPIDDDPNVRLTPEDMEVAKQVFVGRVPCELGAAVTITPAKREGFFLIQTKNVRYLMHPVGSRTGAIRLEDPRHGAMWLQLGNKSMLMSQKLGSRLADECMSPAQVTFADQMKKNPARSLLDGPEPTKAPVAEAGAAASAASVPTTTK
jgi:hypothetical protein